MLRTCVIIGSEGQDGRLLNDRLRGRGDQVIGISRQGCRLSDGTMSRASIDHAESIHRLIAEFHPSEIYYLAAHHHASGDSREATGELFQKSFNVHVQGLIHVLEAIREHSRRTRLFYASSSHVFGTCQSSPQNEQTPLMPNCVYGISKLAGMRCGDFYRRNHTLHVSCGILYNHESPLRSPRFVTQRIVRQAVAISRGKASQLVLSSLSSVVDWGYAPDYVDAMMRIVRADEPGDYVIATGESHTVGEFAEIAFAALGLDYRKYVVEDSSIPPRPGSPLIGDSTFLRSRTGWKPSIDFSSMVKGLVDAALRGEGYSD